jgi:K(+)-stimulated pyrophosphate-energized sodium pump
MNILIKLTCLIGLVIAPILGGHTAGVVTDKASCCAKTEQCASMSKEECEEKGCTNASCEVKGAAAGKCDMSKCATMTKEECAAMCDENGCSAEDKAKCMAMYDENGKFKGEVKENISVKVIMEKVSNDKVKATVTKTNNGKVTEEIIEGTEAEVKAKVDAVK